MIIVENMRAVIASNIIQYRPIKKLALIRFEENADFIYKAFELQYFNGKTTGKGYRVLGYRTDGYVDIYDNYSLIYNVDEECDSVEKGLNAHLRTKIGHVQLEKVDGSIHISFDFDDLVRRKIHVSIKEQLNEGSKTLNILDPVGARSVNPSFLPLYLLYESDFIRRKNTLVDITINEKDIELDALPFFGPINGYMRYNSRYSMDPQIIEFLPEEVTLEEVELSPELTYVHDSISYRFKRMQNGLGLSKIELMHDKKVEILFSPPLTKESQTGRFKVIPMKEMGIISGKYNLQRVNDSIQITLALSQGWKPYKIRGLARFFLSSRSLFRTWNKQYRFFGHFDLNYSNVQAEWINKKFEAEENEIEEV